MPSSGSAVHSADEKTTSEPQVVDSYSSDAGEVVSRQPKRTWRSYIWDSLDKSPEERRFVFKLDVFLMTSACLGNFIKYLDQVNVGNAYVSGMKEDLGLYGNEMNYIVVCWTIGYLLGEIPSNMLITRVRPSIWIPACEVTWSVLTMLLITCKNITHIYVLRFFIGLAEAAFYPGVTYVIGSWYRKDELAKRTVIFLASQFVGAMFSGYLMTATYRLEGVHGYKGWQWLFIVCGIISLPISFLSFFMLPDVPETTRAFYLTKEDVAIANKRMEYEGQAKKSPYTKAKFKKIFSSWRIYALVLLYVLYGNNGNFGGQPGFALWLKAEGHPISSINLFPTISLALAVVLALAYAWTSDSLWRGARWPPIVIATSANMILYTSMAVWNIPIGYKWTYYILSGLANGLGGLIYAWATEICSDDTEERAIVIGTMNTMASVVQVWLPLLIWQQVEAPRYPKGFITMACISTALNATTFLVRFLHKREKARKARQEEVSASGDEHI